MIIIITVVSFYALFSIFMYLLSFEREKILGFEGFVWFMFLLSFFVLAPILAYVCATYPRKFYLFLEKGILVYSSKKFPKNLYELQVGGLGREMQQLAINLAKSRGDIDILLVGKNKIFVPYQKLEKAIFFSSNLSKITGTISLSLKTDKEWITLYSIDYEYKKKIINVLNTKKIQFEEKNKMPWLLGVE